MRVVVRLVGSSGAGLVGDRAAEAGRAGVGVISRDGSLIVGVVRVRDSLSSGGSGVTVGGGVAGGVAVLSAEDLFNFLPVFRVTSAGCTAHRCARRRRNAGLT